MKKTREPQYQDQILLHEKQGNTSLGVKTSHTWHVDPRRLLFTMARYKFAAKMLSGQRRVFEVGCGDAFASRLVKQEVDDLLVTDFDPVFIEDVRSRHDNSWPLHTEVHDFIESPLDDVYDGAFSMDVIEHVPKDKTDAFLGNICSSLKSDAVFVLGTPSLSSQQHASEKSRLGHVNCMDGPQLKALAGRFFRHVFVFGMNDETLHTGFYPMAHYLLAVCASVKGATES
jgi:2-polyprenyl-3-methyl-5-hydroxy-6-metoxy-1,4-benzoquinol methylase